jgi:DNA-binding protein H-NS
METISDIIQNQIGIIEAGLRLTEVVCSAFGFQETNKIKQIRKLLEELKQIKNLPENEQRDAYVKALKSYNRKGKKSRGKDAPTTRVYRGRMDRLGRSSGIGKNPGNETGNPVD